MDDQDKSTRRDISNWVFVIIIIIILLCFFIAFIINSLIVKNNNLSALYQKAQDKISELEVEVSDLLSSQNKSTSTCSRIYSNDYETLPTQLTSTSSTVCGLFTYSDWGTCPSGLQTRTITSQSPVGCVGGKPITSQKCTPPIIPCSSFTYFDWSACSNGNQTRTLKSQSPLGCTEGNPLLKQSCTQPVIPCDSFTYSNWGTCSNGVQTRTTTSKTPAGCSGGNPILTQTCNPPTVDIKVNGQDGIITINSPQKVTFSWTSSNATSCQASGSYNSGSGSGQTLSGSISYYVDSPINITLTCTGPGGTASDSGGVNLVQ
jgi:hypothetical protein